MKTIGSATIETPREAGLIFIRRNWRGCAIFLDKTTGTYGQYVRRSTPHAGHNVKWRGAYYEFTGSIPESHLS